MHEPARDEDACDLSECPWAVLGVIQHVVRKDDVERLVGEGQLLDIRNGVLGAVAEDGARCVDHPGREVREREAPRRVDPLEVLAPHCRRAAADLENARARRRRDAFEQPAVPALRVRREPRVQVDPLVEVRVVPVLRFDAQGAEVPSRP